MARVILACLLVLVLLPLVLVIWMLRLPAMAFAPLWQCRRIPSPVVGPLDRAIFTPYEIRRHRLEQTADATHGFWARLGERVAVSPKRRNGGVARSSW